MAFIHYKWRWREEGDTEKNILQDLSKSYFSVDQNNNCDANMKYCTTILNTKQIIKAKIMAWQTSELYFIATGAVVLR